ncbi:hypothetical protein HK096_005198, partial [Nowakowskiella sp. JEL0078]
MSTAPNESVPGVYRWIIDDVVKKVTSEFVKLGLDDSVLHELQQTWETKLIQSRCANFQPPLFSIDSINAAHPASGAPIAEPNLVKDEPIDYNFSSNSD